jgi:hypothetical protein
MWSQLNPLHNIRAHFPSSSLKIRPSWPHLCLFPSLPRPPHISSAVRLEMSGLSILQRCCFHSILGLNEEFPVSSFLIQFYWNPPRILRISSRRPAFSCRSQPSLSFNNTEIALTFKSLALLQSLPLVCWEQPHTRLQTYLLFCWHHHKHAYHHSILL